MGLSATPERKDGRSFLLSHLIGPQAARATTVSLVPRISLFETGVITKYNHRVWVYAMKFLAAHRPRMKMIINQIFTDYEAGHKGIIIPVDFKAQAKLLKQEIQLEANRRNYDFTFAEVFQSGCNRKKILAKVDSGKVPVLLAIRSMIKQGIDVATPSMIYIVVPMSAVPNIGAPMFYQLSNRVSSYAPNKKAPEIRVFVDGIGASIGCFKGLFRNEIQPKLFRGKNGEQPFYKMDKDDYDRARQLVWTRAYVPMNPEGKYWSSKKIMEKSRVIQAGNKSGLRGF
jgi:hypothetical protein